MKAIISIFYLLVSFLTMAQLTFVEIGSEPAYCRLFGYQSGNGIVYAAATGGTPAYTYQWKNLETEATIYATTWGGLNPGCYEITVTDALGDFIKDTVCLDSVNPIADFEVYDGDLFPSGVDYYGFGISNAQFISTSLNVCNPLASCDTSLFWNFSFPSGDWWLQPNFEPTYWQTFYTDPGLYKVAHVAMNKNGCADTIVKTINIFGPLNQAEIVNENIEVNYFQNELHINNPLNESLMIKIYNASGQLIRTESILEGISSIEFQNPSGLYFIQALNKEYESRIFKVIVP